MRISGKVSWFGGPSDSGVSPSEGLAFIYSVSDKPNLFLPKQPPGTTGLARRLDPEEYYIACRWDYDAPNQSKTELLEHVALVRSTKTGRQFLAQPADWGPHEDTGRVADVSPGLMDALGIETDDEVEVIYPFGEEVPVSVRRIAISAGHGKHVAGAHGYVKEEVETPRVTDAVAKKLKSMGVKVWSFWDQTSTTQDQNLDTIVDWHNSLPEHDLDVSVHFNSSDGMATKPIGTEVWFMTQEDLASDTASAIAAATGLIDRGAKHSSGLKFLNSTLAPAILIECCFVNSKVDVDLYQTKFDRMVEAIAEEISGIEQPLPPVPEPVPPEPEAGAEVTITIEARGNVRVILNP